MIQATDDGSNAAADPVPVPLPPQKKVKRSVKNWNTEAAFPKLRSAVLNSLNNEYNPLLLEQVPEQTLKDAIIKFKKAAALDDIRMTWYQRGSS
jgi:hypothetical protein